MKLTEEQYQQILNSITDKTVDLIPTLSVLIPEEEGIKGSQY